MNIKQFSLWLQSHKSIVAVVLFLTLLVAKFFWPFFLYDVPLGYDPGLYRYLFLQYTESIKNLELPELLPWASEHPPGLFVLGAPFIIAGLPVDMIIGWMWNLFPIILISTLALIIARREGKTIGICVLLMGLLSQAYFDGFFAMYMKAYVSLFFTILTYYAAEKHSFWLVPSALAAVMIHQQTGLILTVSLGIWWVLSLKRSWSDKKFRRITYVLGLAGALAVLWYIPQWERAIWSPLKSIILLRGDNAPAGAFPATTFYVRTMGVVLFLGIFGIVVSFGKERGSLWQLSVLVCAIFIVFRLVFYRRFYLQLDFFLMPFAAIALVWIWNTASSRWAHSMLLLVLIGQAVVGFQAMELRKPRFGTYELSQISSLPEHIEPDASVIALENISGMWLRGWLPLHRIGAPGLFDYPEWSYADWELFIDGSNEQRRTLLEELEEPVYFLLTPSFSRFYGSRANAIINDPCLRVVVDAPLLQSVCSQD
ncbi:MAG: hypothetical protein O3A81_02565 [bacterium]|nr:hypothetical protein [bacterium]